MSGWKTYVAAAAMVAAGLYYTTCCDGHNDIGMMMISTGLGLVGLRHAIERKLPEKVRPADSNNVTPPDPAANI